MPNIPIPFCGPSYQDKTLNASAQRSVNLYPMRTGTDKGKIVMYPTPGYNPAFDLNEFAPCPWEGQIPRGMITINNDLYVAIGGYFVLAVYNGGPFKSGSFTVTQLGTLKTSSGRCSIVTNTVDITISDGQFGYVYNLTTGLYTQIGYSGGWPIQGVTNLTFQDGYYLASPNGTRTVIQSALLDGTTWPALAYDTTTSFPDNIVSVFSDQIILYVFGPTITEPQADVGSIPYAFQKVSSVLIQAGCAAKDSICKVGTTIMFLANDIAGSPYVAELLGYQAKPISTPPINETIANYLRNGWTISDAHAYSYREGDNQFYIITFPSVNNGNGATWAYDVKMQLWHERVIFNGGSTEMRDDVEHYVSWLGHHMVSTLRSYSTLCELTQDSNYESTPGTVPLRRIRTCQNLDASGSTLFINELVVDIEPGVGLQYDNPNWMQSNINPLATLEISRDGAHTYTTVGTAPMGVAGAYLTRLVFRNLGRIRTRGVFRLTISDAVRTYILGATAKIKLGTK